MESDLEMSPQQFQSLTSIYFSPNIVAPLLCGFIAHKYGGTQTLVATQALAVVGHIIFGLGGQFSSYSALFLSRFILGITYEPTDVLPLPVLGPHFREDWGLLVGVFNGALRLGSVANFALTPVLYEWGGIPLAFWCSAAVGITGFVTAMLTFVLDRRLRETKANTPKASKESIDSGIAAEESEEEHELDPEEGLWRSLCVLCSNRAYLLYLLAGIFMYSGIVPWWFAGGAYLRRKWGYSLEMADALMMIMEGGMVIVSPVIGCILDRWPGTLATQALSCMFSMLVVTLGFVLLLVPSADVMPAYLPLGLMGTAWACSNTMLWSTSSHVVPKRYYALGSGLMGSALNVGPSVVPMVMASVPKDYSLGVLAVATALAALVCFFFYLEARSSGGETGRPRAESENITRVSSEVDLSYVLEGH